MGKLRHIAIAVPDADAAATFDEQAFDIVNDMHASNSWRLPV